VKTKKPVEDRLFYCLTRVYFFSSGFFSTAAGAAGVAAAGGAVSAGLAASAAAGAGAATGAGVGAAGAGAGSFLPQAVNAMARNAETRSVRFIIRESWMMLTEV
jgi:hypothetical protein